MTGREIWRRLRAEGGYCWTHSDGSITVHFNRGCRPTPELSLLVRANAGVLRQFVVDLHAGDRAREEYEWRARGLGSSRRAARPVPTRDGGDACDCNVKTRFGISSGGGNSALAAAIRSITSACSAEERGCNEICAVNHAANDGTRSASAGGGFANARENHGNLTGAGVLV